jgi:hypothetical protein
VFLKSALKGMLLQMPHNICLNGIARQPIAK